jgi:hypothetical protein
MTVVMTVVLLPVVTMGIDTTVEVVVAVAMTASRPGGTMAAREALPGVEMMIGTGAATATAEVEAVAAVTGTAATGTAVAVAVVGAGMMIAKRRKYFGS